MDDLTEFISLSDFYHLDVFSAIHVDCETYSIQKSCLTQVLKNYSSNEKKTLNSCSKQSGSPHQI